ncbi:MAG: cadherin-like beta sandwich domain-containing protein [Spirochaetes bacterium]|nr:MAG: cadherin-like beta sandwich domain-containing protein [Spirochaetota bacterium]
MRSFTRLSACVLAGAFVFLSLAGCDHGSGKITEFESGLSDDALIKTLAISEGELNYPFNPSDFAYTLTVRNGVSAIRVTPVLDHRKAVMTVNGQRLASGAESPSLTVNVGDDNRLIIAVTAEDGSAHTYRITVVRNAEETECATLGELSVSGITGLDPAFDAASATRIYTAETQAEQVGLTAAAAWEALGACVEITHNDIPVTDPACLDLVIGMNIIVIAITAADGASTDSYTLKILRRSSASDNANLSVLAIDGVSALTPAFDPGDTANSDYAATVSASMVPIRVTATPQSTEATVAYFLDGAAVSDPASIDLPLDTNSLLVRVTGGDGTTIRDYTITITKTTGNTNAKLSAMAFVTGVNSSMRPLYHAFGTPDAAGFQAERTSYAAVVYACATIDLTVTAQDPNVSSISINGGSGEHAAGVKTVSVSLTKGLVTDVGVTVTAEDGASTATYTLAVKLLNMEEFYWGIYAPLMNNSFARWESKFGSKLPTKTVNIGGLVAGNLEWYLGYTEGTKILNRLTLTDYKDGNHDGEGFTIRVPYNDNGGAAAYDGFVVNGQTQGILQSAFVKDGIQTGTYAVTTPWGDSIGTVDFHYVIDDGNKVVDPNSYVTFHYMGEDQVILYQGSSAPYPFGTGYDWRAAWDDGL